MEVIFIVTGLVLFFLLLSEALDYKNKKGAFQEPPLPVGQGNGAPIIRPGTVGTVSQNQAAYDDDEELDAFAASMMIGAATGDVTASGMIGGSMIGAVVGVALVEQQQDLGATDNSCGQSDDCCNNSCGNDDDDNSDSGSSDTSSSGDD
jgi:hypothetical protein